MKEAIITKINYVSKDGKAWANSNLKNAKIFFNQPLLLKAS